MSEHKNRKYWYFRFRQNFFNDVDIIKMQVIPGGYEFLVILLKMYALSTAENGVLKVPTGPDGNIDIVVFSAMLGNLHQPTIISCALNYFLKTGLIELMQEEDETLIICAEVKNMTGKSSREADIKREYRQNLPQPERKSKNVERLESYEVYGEFQNVHLTDAEYQKFFKRYENAKAIIQRLSVWKASKNIENVTNDYAYLLSFADKDGRLIQSEKEKRKICYERCKREAVAGFEPSEADREILTAMQYEELKKIANVAYLKEQEENRRRQITGNESM